MSAQDYSDLTTDAVPDRRNPTNFGKADENCYEDLEDKPQHSNEEVRNSYPKTNPFKGFTKFKKHRIPSAQATIINISNSNGPIHVGDSIVYNLNNDKSEKSVIKIKETDAIKTLKQSNVPLQRDDLLFVATHMNESWKDAIRQLNYSEGQIEQFYLDYREISTKEVIFQLLLDWSRNKPEEATIGTLCSILWDNCQQDVVKRLSEKKD